MNRTIAFYAPLKPPDHPNPSGDRMMARALLTALSGLEGMTATLASRLRTREPDGDAAAQDRLFRAAEAEIARLAAGPRPALWITYHNYYKAPDLIGPAVARAHGVAYVLIESTRASKRLDGPWARFARAAEAATDAADLVFHMTGHDAEALEARRPEGQRLMRLRPFLDRALAAETPPPPPTVGPPRLITVAMMREDQKLLSYRALASALALVTADWRLEIIGDGAARAAVETLFRPFGARVTFLGRLPPEAMRARYRAAELLIWPGVKEAFGLVYLEAQAEARAVLAEDRPGVRDVARAGAALSPADDPAAFAAAIDALAADRPRLHALGRAGWTQVAAEHDLAAARRTLREGLAPLLAPAGARA